MPVDYTAPAPAQTEDPYGSGSLRAPNPGEAADRVNQLAAAVAGQVKSSIAALETAPPAHAHADATASTKGFVQLAGDLAGTNSTAAAPRISDSAFILRG